jgi:type I restriction enzyme S subunit
MEKQMNIPKLRFSEFEGEWKKKKVGELCDSIVPGRNKPTDFEGDIPWITTPDIEHNGIITISKKGLKISKEQAKKIGSKIVPQNSIVISCVGDLGLSAIAGTEIVINQQLHAFLPKEKIEYRFLLYQLNLQKKYMDMVATKTAVPYMNKDNCNSIPITFPTLLEQKRIASFFMVIDKKITELKQKKILLEQYKKGVIQKLFSQELRFRDENGREFPKWEENKLGEVFYCEKGKGISKNKVVIDGKYECVLYGELYTKYDEVIFEVVSKTNEDDGTKSKIGDLLIPSSTTTTGIDLANVTALNKDNVLLGGDITILRSNGKTNNVFYAYYFSNHKKEEIASYAQGSTIVHLYYSHIKDMQIDIPCIEEQTKIAKFLSAIDDKINRTEIQIQQTDHYKKGLLQKMFC